jgi:hypothetical protein
MQGETTQLLVFLIIPLTWGLTIFQSHRLGRRFIAKYPKIAWREIPDACSHFAHPRNALFFFSSKARELISGDAELWKERQRLIVLSIASMAAPPIVFLLSVLTE